LPSLTTDLVGKNGRRTANQPGGATLPAGLQVTTVGKVAELGPALWRLLPAQELGCGSPATCWRRLTEWAKAGVFDQLHLEVLDRLGVDGQLEWSRASVDTMSVRARRGGIMLAQIPSIAANPDPSSTWSATAMACR
jgi:transposase